MFHIPCSSNIRFCIFESPLYKPLIEILMKFWFSSIFNAVMDGVNFVRFNFFFCFYIPKSNIKSWFIDENQK